MIDDAIDCLVVGDAKERVMLPLASHHDNGTRLIEYQVKGAVSFFYFLYGCPH